MNRLVALLLLVGGVLLLSWKFAPASTVAPPPQNRESARDTTPVVQQMNADVDRLRRRLDAVPHYPEPVRDPFRYGRRAAIARSASTPAASPEPDIVQPAVPTLPRLLAILADTVDGVPTFRAVMAVGVDVAAVKAVKAVKIVKVGDSVGGLHVRVIAGDAVELLDSASLKIFRVVLK